MPDQMHPTERAARQYNRDKKQQATLMAADMAPARDTVRYEAKDERKAFWQRNPQVDEQAIWTGMLGEMMQDGTVTYEEAIKIAASWVAMEVYPARLPLIRQGDRKLSVEAQKTFSDRMERLGPPEEGETDV